MKFAISVDAKHVHHLVATPTAVSTGSALKECSNQSHLVCGLPVNWIKHLAVGSYQHTGFKDSVGSLQHMASDAFCVCTDLFRACHAGNLN